MHKADSAFAACRALDSRAHISLFRDGLTPQNAEAMCRLFDVVVDCSDNAPTRYLVNDACVSAGRPLVSGAAVGTDGQLTVYNHAGGPCYRYVNMISALTGLEGAHAMHWRAGSCVCCWRLAALRNACLNIGCSRKCVQLLSRHLSAVTQCSALFLA
jgi:molybdopterin/thiamine biosynthesis adenylyltransferase